MKVASALSVAATLLTTISAFIVVPDLGAKAGKSGMPLDPFVSLNSQSWDAECAECAFLVDPELAPAETSKTLDVNNKIHLEFAAIGSEFFVNGVVAWPVFPADKYVPEVHARQIRDDNNEIGLETRLGFAIQVNIEEAPSPNYHRAKFGRMRPDESSKHVVMDFTVLDLGGMPVKAQTVQIDMLREENGDLVLLNVQGEAFDPSKDKCGNARNPSMCRVTTMIAERFRQMIQEAKDRAAGLKSWLKKPNGLAPKPDHKPGKKPCGGRRKPFHFGSPRPNKPPHDKGPFHFGPDSLAPRPSNDGPFRFGDDPATTPPPHGHHNHRHHHSRLAHLIHQVIRTIVMPIVLGIVGGLAVSALGMMIGQSIACLWLKFGRRNNPPMYDVVVVEEVDEEKVGLMAEEREVAPPEYRDVEAQVDGEVEVVKS